MRPISRFACFALLSALAIPALAQTNPYQYVYLRSNFDQPWGQTTNEDAMDNVFGAGNWTTMYYETTGPYIFSSNTLFIFMEGGDSSFDSFQTFVQYYGNQLGNWVQHGGRLLIMAAPNDPLSSANVSLPDNITLLSDAFYGSASSSAYAVDVSNAMFNGPNQTVYNFTGNFFSHGYFTGNDVNALMLSNLNEVVLGQDAIGSGLMLFGGLTTDNFDLPQPAAHSLLENIIYYTAFTQL